MNIEHFGDIIWCTPNQQTLLKFDNNIFTNLNINDIMPYQIS